jgi:putative transcriptional regulator
MTIVHHPDPATLMSFAAGTLGEALSAAIATHVDLCPACRRESKRLDVLGGLLMQELAPVGVAAPTVTQTEAAAASPSRIVADAVLPPTLVRLLGGGLDRVRWSPVAPGVHVMRLPMSSGSDGILALIRIAAGRSIPEHSHGGSELTLVLSGSFRDETGRYHRGDIADLDDEIEHLPIADEGSECICLFASEAKLKYKGALPRLLQPIIGI